MTSSKAMFERSQCVGLARHQGGVPTVARRSATSELDRRSRPGVAPSLAVAVGPAESSVPWADVVATRARRLLEARITFVGHPSFSDSAMAAEILGPMQGPDAGRAPRQPESPEDLPAPAAGFPEPRLLTRAQEAHLFRKMNFLKSVAARLRAAIDPDKAVTAEIDQVEDLLREAGAILDRIIRANQGMVVSIVKKYTWSGRDFFDWVSDGNVALLRASEHFDFARGVRFSTYATWTILREFARRIRQANASRPRFVTGCQDFFQSVVDYRSGDLPEPTPRERSTDAVRSLLSQLNDRERTIIVRRFGLVAEKRTLEELGRELGVSKERVRQLEARALSKLRDHVEGQEPHSADS
jgi:RNA polymerase primary sigma factor